MRILHLLSNVKLTGPAEPAINLCASLKTAGYDVLFACGSPNKTGLDYVQKASVERGLEPVTIFRLNKHLNVIDNLRDLRLLPAFLRESNVDIVHAHLDNDHLLGGWAARRTGKRISVIRSCYSGDGMRLALRSRYLLARLTDGLIAASPSARAAVLKSFSFPEHRLWVVEGAVDLRRFDPSRSLPDMRPAFGLQPSDFVVGVVARIQPYRRFEALLDAMEIVSHRDPSIKLLIVGRGSNMEWVAVQPVERMGLGHCVKFAGYHKGDDYVATLACFDAKIFLVPGTDGTCRAVREAMAMGKPVIAARRGMLSEIVDDEENGLVIDDTPENLAESILLLAKERENTRRMGLKALNKARSVFGLDHQAQQVAEIYRQVHRQPGA